MLDQDHLQKIIRAYISISVMMNSDTISPKTKAYLREASKALEETAGEFAEASEATGR